MAVIVAGRAAANHELLRELRPLGSGRLAPLAVERIGDAAGIQRAADTVAAGFCAPGASPGQLPFSPRPALLAWVAIT